MTGRPSLIDALRGLTRTDWAFVHFKAALGLVWLIPLTQIAYLKKETAPLFIFIWGAITVAGFVVSIVGLVMSAQQFETRRNGFRVEMSGLILLMSAPGIYGLIQIGLIFTKNDPSRWTAFAFAYIICAAIVPRMVMIKEAAKSRTVIYRFKEPND